jgi:hypothetical protein
MIYPHPGALRWHTNVFLNRLSLFDVLDRAPVLFRLNPHRGEDDVE